MAEPGVKRSRSGTPDHSSRALESVLINAAFIAACRSELAALKPGNVHAFAPGHRMQVSDFERSAEAAAPHIANLRLSVGLRTRRAVDATWDAVGCNTNLGIVLLCAPIAAAAGRPGGKLRQRLSQVLADLDRKDASHVYRAIARANPAGLGSVPEADVSTRPQVTLREAMALAAPRDRIARAYVTDFEDVLVFGLSKLAKARRDAQSQEDAVTALHMDFMSKFADSHIARKHGMAVAKAVRSEAKLLLPNARPPIGSAARRKLLEFDTSLKSRGLNPGTTADFVVATLFAATISESLAARPAR